MTTVEWLWTEMFLLGSSLTWDSQAQAGYLHIDPNPDAYAIARTVTLDGGVNVDLDANGRVRGIETFGHEVGMLDLLRVLRWCTFTDDQAEAL